MACAAFFLISAPAGADRVVLRNGDSITGSGLALDAQSATIASDALVELTVPRDKIARLMTDKPVDVTFTDGNRMRGTVAVTTEGWLRLALAHGRSQPFPLSAIKTITAVTSAEAAKEAPPWKSEGNINAGFTSASGNTNSDIFHLDGKVAARRGDHRLTGRAEANYRKEEGDETARNALLRGKHDRFISEKWFLYTSLGFDHDGQEDLDLRTSLGTGAGYQIVDTERSKASVEGGPSYVIENRSEDDDKDFAALRWSADLSYDPILKKLRLFHYDEVLAGITGGNGIILKSRTGIRYFLMEGLNATAQVNYDWESDPSPGTKETDTTYLLTVGYAW